ncbi:hypothetical protein ACFFGE_05225 [Brevundimonas balnearis]|uniref:HNH endonuclease n=2 Tax=Brevundimonas balnearis TaxID=1572858 RepID=A0ABV6R0Y2_9CAUL
MARNGGRPDQRSAEAHDYRRLYKTARWRRVRETQLSANPLCAMCLEDGRVTPATVCDHVDPKDKLDPELFFTGKKASLCGPHHNSTKQRMEKRGHGIGHDASGLPLDPNHPWNR